MKKLSGSLIPVQKLTQEDRERMFVLLDEHFSDVRYDAFIHDLNEKDWVIVLRDCIDNVIQGFSTQKILEVSLNGKVCRALFSGDTIVSRAYWQQTELMRIWGLFVLRLIDEYHNDELYWFLISMGYRTYRFLPVFFKEFYPCYKAEMPPEMKARIDTFARLKYPFEYNPLSGVIRLASPCMKLKKGISDVTEQLLSNPHINFFVGSNPFHYAGDELACIARLSRDNFNRAAYKMIGSEAIAL